MKRRSFLAGILSLGAAPAVVKAESIMRIVPRKIIAPFAFDNSFAELYWQMKEREDAVKRFCGLEEPFRLYNDRIVIDQSRRSERFGGIALEQEAEWNKALDDALFVELTRVRK